MTTSNKVCSSFVLGLILTALPAVGYAQPAPQPSAADLESARELFKEGRELRQAGELRKAVERFKAAHAYGQTPVTALELGRTQMQVGDLIEAREVLLSVARMKVQPDETEKSAAARAEAADLAEDAKKRIPTLSVTLTGITSDAAAQVTVDGATVPVVGLVGLRKANPGKHVVIAKAGTREETRNVDLEESKTQELAIDLAGGTASLADARPDVGDAKGADAGSKVISPVTWIGLGVGVVGIGVGTVAGILALGKASDVKSACSGLHCPPPTKTVVDSGRTTATLSTVGFIVGGAGLAAAAVGYFVLSKPQQSSASAVRVTPYVTAGSLGLDGSF